jgi:acyl-CoA synthetase (NDP forming)
LHSELCQCVEQITKDFPSKPLLFYFYGPFADEAKDELEGTGRTLVFPSPDRAIRALGHLADYSEFRRKS